MSEQQLPVEVAHDALATRQDVDPAATLANATRAAKALQDVVSKKKNPVIIRGEQYLTYEDWQLVAAFFECHPQTHDAEPVEVEGVFGFKARGTVINRDGIVIANAEAYCMRDEKNWKTRDTFMLASMAQTRAGAKALRNAFAWVAVLAGYRPTPAEEMDGVGNSDVSAQQRKATTPTAARAATPPEPQISNTGIPDADFKAVYAKASAKGIGEQEHKDFIAEMGLASRKDMTLSQFAEWEDWIDEYPEPAEARAR